jgi:chaperonin cofactor prefoldin
MKLLEVQADLRAQLERQVVSCTNYEEKTQDLRDRLETMRQELNSGRAGKHLLALHYFAMSLGA